jgi:hypothetical protein
MHLRAYVQMHHVAPANLPERGLLLRGTKRSSPVPEPRGLLAVLFDILDRDDPRARVRGVRSSQRRLTRPRRRLPHCLRKQRSRRRQSRGARSCSNSASRDRRHRALLLGGKGTVRRDRSPSSRASATPNVVGCSATPVRLTCASGIHAVGPRAVAYHDPTSRRLLTHRASPPFAFEQVRALPPSGRGRVFTSEALSGPLRRGRRRGPACRAVRVSRPPGEMHVRSQKRVLPVRARRAIFQALAAAQYGIG